MFLIMKRSKDANEKYPQLMPAFRKVAKVEKLPEEWEIKIPQRWGEGEYVITGYGEGRWRQIFHGFLELQLGDTNGF